MKKDKLLGRAEEERNKVDVFIPQSLGSLRIISTGCPRVDVDEV